MANKKTPNKYGKRRWYVLAFLLFVYVFIATRQPSSEEQLLEEAKEKPLAQIINYVEDKKVDEVEIFDQLNTIVVTLENGDTYKSQYPYAYSGDLTQIVLDADADLEAHSPTGGPSILVSLVFSILPLLLILGVLVWVIRSGGLTGGIGKLTGKRGQAIGEIPDVTFADVAGAEEASGELKELVEFLQDGGRFEAVGAKAPRGALLVGPPGTGKTLLARAVAGESKVPFFPLAGSDFVETFVGVGAKRVRDLFDKAREAGSAIIFIDEIDAVGRSRSSGPTNAGEGERENTLVSMLNEMDGFDSSHRIIVIAATNRPEILDEALIRPGRLDRQIHVPLPDRRGREAILKVHAKDRPIADDVDFEEIARRTPGTSGAELAQIVNEACMEAARKSAKEVNQDCFSAAIATAVLGRARTSALVTETDREITAWHEAGHTIAALLLEDADDPVQVSIIPRGPAGGVTWMSGNDNIFLTRKKAYADLMVSMAGRAAEEVLLDGEYTQGAHGDLNAASRRALEMVTQYGMNPNGSLLLAEGDTVRMGGEVSAQLRKAADDLLQEALVSARKLLKENKKLLQAIAASLLEKENLNLRELKELQKSVALP